MTRTFDDILKEMEAEIDKSIEKSIDAMLLEVLRMGMEVRTFTVDHKIGLAALTERVEALEKASK